LSNVFRRQVKQGEIFPSITVIIAAYNEEKNIKAKLENTLLLNYPAEKREIIVVSDFSSDTTDEIVAGFASEGVRLMRTPERRGKTGAQNIAMGEAKGEIIVFSDATAIYEKESLRKIVRSFDDPSVGGVEGRLIYESAETGFIGNKDLQKSYEAYIKKMESQIWTGVGDNGAFYAIRRELCRPLREDLTSDFAAPLDVTRQRKRFIFDDQALSFDKVSSNSQDEFKRKIRTVRAGINVFVNSFDLLNPFRYGWVSYVLVGRKLSRWLSSVMLPLLLISNLFLLPQSFYVLFLISQSLCYVFAIAGIIAGDSFDRIKLISIPKSFFMVNLAAMRGIASFVVHRNQEIWTPKR